ncbi:MAG: hypothetical protein HQL57_10835 [Magnetococcales bacterium]|nr:hypothetical protein [Magnetococcales bacterium]MBF0157668.1 hypothetical protein [Magnetococcales bacterium]
MSDYATYVLAVYAIALGVYGGAWIVWRREGRRLATALEQFRNGQEQAP